MSKSAAERTDFAAYVFYVNRPDLLCRSISAFPDLQPHLTVVNNSGHPLTEGPSDGGPTFEAAEVFEPPVPLTYSQSMNWMLADATKKGVDFIVHFHSDAYSTNLAAVSSLLDYARRVRDESRRWACLWTLYDILWIINPVAARAVGGWDTLFPDYYTDQAMAQRWRRHGWELINTNIQGIGHDKGDGVGGGHHGSSTINSDPQLRFIHQMVDPLYGMLYQAMYKGTPGHEGTLVPFDRPDLFR